MNNLNVGNHSKRLVILILSVFLVFGVSFRIGAFRTNSPVYAGEDLLIYSSIVNNGNKDLKDARLSYIIFSERFSDAIKSRTFNVKDGTEKGRTSVHPTAGLNPSEYFLKVSVNHDGDIRSRYLPVDILMG